MAHFDLAIIGTGSGNSLVTPDFDGKQVAIIEGGTFGGTCLNVGCIPTKMFVYAADVAHAVTHAAPASASTPRWTACAGRTSATASSAGSTPSRAAARTTGPHGEQHDRVPRPRPVHAARGPWRSPPASTPHRRPGGHRHRQPPRGPRRHRRSGVPFHTSDTVMRIEELPARMVILGGGYIAAEFAHVFSALGVHVTLVVRGTRLLRHARLRAQRPLHRDRRRAVGRPARQRRWSARPATTSPSAWTSPTAAPSRPTCCWSPPAGCPNTDRPRAGRGGGRRPTPTAGSRSTAYGRTNVDGRLGAR